MSTVLITGANRGLGLEFARQYKADGWEVIATCRDPAQALDLQSLGVSVETLDVGDLTDIAAFGARMAGRPLDLFLNNAGTYGGKGTEQTFGRVDAAVWEETLKVNAIAPLKLLEALLPTLEAAAPGSKAVFLSSKMGSMAENTSGRQYIYRSSKAALNAVVKSLGFELADRGISATAFHPGWVRTDMGGPEGLLSVEESVTAMRGVIAGLTVADAGRFLNYDGAELPW